MHRLGRIWSTTLTNDHFCLAMAPMRIGRPNHSNASKRQLLCRAQVPQINAITTDTTLYRAFTREPQMVRANTAIVTGWWYTYLSEKY